MDIDSAFGLQQLLIHVIGDMARAVSERRGGSQEQQFTRAQAAAQSIVAFRPGDVIEAMLAGHCVMFHELIVDTVQDTFRGEPDATRRAARNSIVAMDKAFGNNLIRLRQHRARLPKAAADVPPTDALAETEILDRVHRHESATQTEAYRAEPDAPQTLNAEPRPAAVASMAGLNRQARREINRQARGRNVPGSPTGARTPGCGVTPTRNAPATTASATRAG